MYIVRISGEVAYRQPFWLPVKIWLDDYLYRTPSAADLWSIEFVGEESLEAL